MVDAAGTTTYSYTAGGQLWTEDGPWSNDTVTNSYTYRMRTGLALQQPTGVWTNGFSPLPQPTRSRRTHRAITNVRTVPRPATSPPSTTLPTSH